LNFQLKDQEIILGRKVWVKYMLLKTIPSI